MKKDNFSTKIHTDKKPNSFKHQALSFFSCYTPFGIKMIESNFISRIKNINCEVSKVFKITREYEKHISRDGKEYEGVNMIDVLIEISPYKQYLGETHVFWANGEQRKFTNGDERTLFLENTKKECPKQLANEIKKNLHLDKSIKQNLLFNLKTYCEKFL